MIDFILEVDGLTINLVLTKLMMVNFQDVLILIKTINHQIIISALHL